MKKRVLTPLMLYNSASRTKEPFQVSEDRLVKMYTCGPTVYDYAHIGNYRTYIFEDLLRRTLQFFGLKVIQVMNLTDVDDKTIRGAIKQQVSLDAYTEPFKKAFFEDLNSLNIEPAEHYPAATDYIPQMIEMIEVLMRKGFAYKGGDGSIYYAIHRFGNYGCLSHLKLDELKAGASERVSSDEYEKESLADFVLWKAYDPERDGKIFWESPFGPGRPGWHLECSAMAMNILGETIDLHCGGVDNMFPHHENEIAQSESCSGVKFVRVWMHSEHLVVDHKKMSKSLGNFHTLRSLLDRGFSGLQVRYMLLQVHYKTQLNFTLEGLDAAKGSLSRLNSFLERMANITSQEEGGLVAVILEEALNLFQDALADDLNISKALAAVFEMVRKVNALCDEAKLSESEAKEVISLMKRFNQVLGIFSFEKKDLAIPQELSDALVARNLARQNKEWQKADALRQYIQENGYEIEDTPQGARLHRR